MFRTERNTKIVKNCRIDKKRLEPIEEAICGQETDPQSQWPEWPVNVISTIAVAYSCGMIARQGTTVTHQHDATELALCRRLSSQIAKIMKGTYLEFADESTHEYMPFYICAMRGAEAPQQITEQYIRSVFGGTIHPEASIKISAMETSKAWWWVTGEGNLKAWTTMSEWFHARRQLHHPSIVVIGEHDRDGMQGAVFPRLPLALTEKGSLVGLCGCVVNT